MTDGRPKTGTVLNISMTGSIVLSVTWNQARVSSLAGKVVHGSVS
jgi:hypothetical protein